MDGAVGLGAANRCHRVDGATERFSRDKGVDYEFGLCAYNTAPNHHDAAHDHHAPTGYNNGPSHDDDCATASASSSTTGHFATGCQRDNQSAERTEVGIGLPRSHSVFSKWPHRATSV